MVGKSAKMFSLCLVAILISTASAVEKSGRIVDGRIIDIGQAPYAVQLRRSGHTFCGGTLVTQYHVVTAAHCVDKGLDGVVVVGNANTRFDEGIVRSIVNYVIPREYSRETGLYRDIAVLKLDRPMYGGVTTPLRLCSQPWAPGQYIQVSGWGRLSENGEASTQLRTVFLSMLSHEECLSRNHFTEYMSDSKECAFGQGQDACQGDSGGPAVYRGELCGVVSSGYGCADPLYPGIYTSVYTMRDFIQNALDTL